MNKLKLLEGIDEVITRNNTKLKVSSKSNVLQNDNLTFFLCDYNDNLEYKYNNDYDIVKLIKNNEENGSIDYIAIDESEIKEYEDEYLPFGYEEDGETMHYEYDEIEKINELTMFVELKLNEKEKEKKEIESEIEYYEYMLEVLNYKG